MFKILIWNSENNSFHFSKGISLSKYLLENRDEFDRRNWIKTDRLDPAFRVEISIQIDKKLNQMNHLSSEMFLTFFHQSGKSENYDNWTPPFLNVIENIFD